MATTRKNSSQLSVEFFSKQGRKVKTIKSARVVAIYLRRKPLYSIEFHPRASEKTKTNQLNRVLFEAEATLYLRRLDLQIAREFLKQQQKQYKKIVDRVEDLASDDEQIDDIKTTSYGVEFDVKTPKESAYDKKLYLHKCYSPTLQETILLKKLDFSLKNPIKLNKKNLGQILQLAHQKIFMPHLIDFYKKSKGSKHLFIFRLKYIHRFTKKIVWVEKEGIFNNYMHQGYGIDRFEAFNQKGFLRFVERSYSGFEREFDRYFSRKFTKSMELSGFSIDVVDKKEK